MNREATVERNTKETQIQLTYRVDGTGKADIQSGVGFFDHMLDGFTRHGLFDLWLRVNGDLQVDDHHTIEDTGIVLGTAIKEAIGDKKGICRYGSCILPMDETLVLCAVDLSGRPYFVFDGAFSGDKMGDMSTQMVREFFYAISYTAGMNLHLKVPEEMTTMSQRRCLRVLRKRWIRRLCLIRELRMYFLRKAPYNKGEEQ